MSDHSRLGGVTRREALKALGAGSVGTLAGGSSTAAWMPLIESRPAAKVVIVGAGFAGLTAARDLVRRGVEVALLDARDRVGGRVKAGKLAGHAIDLGGTWVGPTQTALLALLKAYGIPTTPQYIAGKCILEVDGTLLNGEGDVAPLSPADDAELLRLMEALNTLAAQVPLESPWTASRAAEWDRLTMDEWLRSETRNRVVVRLMHMMIRGIFTTEPHQISLLYFLFYVRSGDSIQKLWGVKDAAQAFHVPGSMHQLADRIAKDLGSAIVLQAPATAISQDARAVTITTAKGVWKGDYAIVAVPLPLSTRIAYDPALPAARDALAQRSPMGSVIKYWVAYRQPFWRHRGLNAMVSSDEPPTSGFFDVSPPSGEVGLIAGFIDAGSALEWSGRPMADRRRLIVGRIVHFLGSQAADPIDYLDNDWPADPWTRGCFGASMGPGVLTTLGPALRTPFGRIHWAGSETSTVWTGYIEGAVRSGSRAAAEVLSRLGEAVQHPHAGGGGRDGFAADWNPSALAHRA